MNRCAAPVQQLAGETLLTQLTSLTACARIGPSHKRCEWAVLSIQPDQPMHGSGERDAHNPCTAQSSSAVSNSTVDAAQHTRRVLHLPEGLEHRDAVTQRILSDLAAL